MSAVWVTSDIKFSRRNPQQEASNISEIHYLNPNLGYSETVLQIYDDCEEYPNECNIIQKFERECTNVTERWNFCHVIKSGQSQIISDDIMSWRIILIYVSTESRYRWSYISIPEIPVIRWCISPVYFKNLMLFTYLCSILMQIDQIMNHFSLRVWRHKTRELNSKCLFSFVHFVM